MNRPCNGCNKPVTLDKTVVKNRYEICKRCEHRKSVTIPYVKKIIEYCNACGCPLATRLRTSCDKGKF